MTDIIAAAPLGIGSPAQLATGSFVGTGNAASLVLGFMPRFVRIIDTTLNIEYTKVQGDPANTCVKNAASAQTVDTTGLITFPIDTGLNEPGSTVLLSAALAAVGSVISFAVFG